MIFRFKERINVDWRTWISTIHWSENSLSCEFMSPRTECEVHEDTSLKIMSKKKSKTQRICLKNCSFSDIFFDDKTVKEWKELSIKKVRYSRSSTRKKCEVFFSLVFGFPTLFKIDSGPDVFVGSNGGPWSKNELCRLLHLFQEPTVMESVSTIYGGLQDREQLDQKSLR